MGLIRLLTKIRGQILERKLERKLGRKLESSFFANKTLNFGPIFKFFKMLFAELSDKTHYMCNFFVQLIWPAQWSVKDERPRKKGKFRRVLLLLIKRLFLDRFAISLNYQLQNYQKKITHI